MFFFSELISWYCWQLPHTFSHPNSRFWQDNKLKERRSSPSRIIIFLLCKWVVIIMHLWVNWHIRSLSLTFSSLGGNWRTWTWKSSSQSAGMVSFVYILRWTVIILLIFVCELMNYFERLYTVQNAWRREYGCGDDLSWFINHIVFGKLSWAEFVTGPLEFLLGETRFCRLWIAYWLGLSKVIISQIHYQWLHNKCSNICLHFYFLFLFFCFFCP